MDSRSCSPVLASSVLLESRISAMVSSSMSMAFISPSRMWYLFSAWFRSNCVLLTTTFLLWSM